MRPTEVARPTLCAVVCAADPARRIEEFVRQAQATGWSVRVVLTPTAADWLDIDALARVTGRPVATRPRRPDEPRVPPPEAVVVVPATFNTINKWAAGINDSPALGVLNESIGLRLPVVVAPCAKDILTMHPAFDRNIRLLAEHGVTFLPTNAIQPTEDPASLIWHPILAALPALSA